MAKNHWELNEKLPHEVNFMKELMGFVTSAFIAEFNSALMGFVTPAFIAKVNGALVTSHKGWRLLLSPLYMYKLRPSCQVSNTEIVSSIL